MMNIGSFKRTAEVMESTSMMILRNKEHLGGRSEQKGKYDKSIVGGRWNKQQDRDKEDP